MGLNGCKGQGRSRDNACAGQGYCSTALEYNYANPSAPQVSDHTCHVKNACAGQGGCGLYGTAEEQNRPAANACATLGSCAGPAKYGARGWRPDFSSPGRHSEICSTVLGWGAAADGAQGTFAGRRTCSDPRLRLHAPQ